jgi:hypothetical protein
LIIKSFDTIIWYSVNALLWTLSPTNLLPIVGYLRFLYVSSSWWRLLCHHKSANWYDSCLQCAFQRLVHGIFMRASCCFPPWSCSWEQHAAFQDSPLTTWNMPIVHTRWGKICHGHTVCLGALARACASLDSASRRRSAARSLNIFVMWFLERRFYHASISL